MYSLIGSLPKHKYVWVDTKFTHEEDVGFKPAVWFGLVSVPGRVWGCNVMFENGAVYRSIPPHAISFTENQDNPWKVDQSQLWNCYGYKWTALEYVFLEGLKCTCLIGKDVFEGEYIFTVAPMEDGFSMAPEQSKEFMFIKLINGRLTIQPTNKVKFIDKSFTQEDSHFGKLKLQENFYSCE